MYPEDRVLVGVINRKRDFEKAQAEHWYRIPVDRVKRAPYVEYIALFFSRAFKELNGGIHTYARRTGVELAYRRDLIPEEAQHPRADALYYKLQFGELYRKVPPILNPDKRVVTFIHTTWDRFEVAETLADLYSEADHFVDRVFHALERKNIHPERVWEASRQSDDGGAQLRIECEDGTVIASTNPMGEHVIKLDPDASPESVRASFEAIVAAIKAYGGPLLVNVPLED